MQILLYSKAQYRLPRYRWKIPQKAQKGLLILVLILLVSFRSIIPHARRVLILEYTHHTAKETL